MKLGHNIIHCPLQEYGRLLGANSVAYLNVDTGVFGTASSILLANL